MRVLIAERFARSCVDAPPEVQKAFSKQLAILLRNLRHRSLDAKKYDRAGDVWQARVKRGLALLPTQGNVGASRRRRPIR